MSFSQVWGDPHVSPSSRFILDFWFPSGLLYDTLIACDLKMGIINSVSAWTLIYCLGVCLYWRKEKTKSSLLVTQDVPLLPHHHSLSLTSWQHHALLLQVKVRCTIFRQLEEWKLFGSCLNYKSRKKTEKNVERWDWSHKTDISFSF